jgi:ferredoxin
MAIKIIPKDKLGAMLENLKSSHKVFVPSAQDSTTKFVEFEGGDFALPGFLVAKEPPKEILFPKTQVLFSYKNLPDGDVELDSPKEPESEQIIFGLRDCDARAFNVLDTFFASGQYTDTLYFNNRNKTATIGVACNLPVKTCFCTSVGGAPFSTDGLDAQLIDVGDQYLLRSVTERGEKLVVGLKDFKDGKDKDLKQVKKLSEEAEKRISPIDGIDGIEKKLDDLFDCEIWDYDGSTCLGCGTCAFTCPTCTCFDVLEKGDQSGGSRVRVWDSCQFPLFTLEGSGHNPRTLRRQRVRQRLYHKFNYYIKNYETLGCIGCGRCIRACPAGGSVRETLEEVIQRN